MTAAPPVDQPSLLRVDQRNHVRHVHQLVREAGLGACQSLAFSTVFTGIM
jgi:hypothetical protein